MCGHAYAILYFDRRTFVFAWWMIPSQTPVNRIFDLCPFYPRTLNCLPLGNRQFLNIADAICCCKLTGVLELVATVHWYIVVVSATFVIAVLENVTLKYCYQLLGTVNQDFPLLMLSS